jgi:hypothetical protein
VVVVLAVRGVMQGQTSGAAASNSLHLCRALQPVSSAVDCCSGFLFGPCRCDLLAS